MTNEQNIRPSERFAGQTGVLDLEWEASDLLGRAIESEHGHTQRTLYRLGGATIAMFALREHAALPPHAADGVVSVHVLRGRVRVHAGGETFELEAGRLIRMTPGLEHDLHAEAPSVVLVHIARGAMG